MRARSCSMAARSGVLSVVLTAVILLGRPA
jgi:hypothetical protein